MDFGHDYTMHPVEGLLTTDGIQYSAEVETTTADTDVTAFSYAFDLGFDHFGQFMSRQTRKILTCYFEIHTMLKAESSGTAGVKFKAQARNKDGTWVDLFAWVTYANIGIVYLEKTYKGYADIQANFQEVPFDFRVIFQCNEVDEGRAKIKNTSYFRCIFMEAE